MAQLVAWGLRDHQHSLSDLTVHLLRCSGEAAGSRYISFPLQWLDYNAFLGVLQARCVGEMVTGEVPLAVSEAERGGAAVYSVDKTEISLSSTSPAEDTQPEVFLHRSRSRRALESAFTLASV